MSRSRQNDDYKIIPKITDAPVAHTVSELRAHIKYLEMEFSDQVLHAGHLEIEDYDYWREKVYAELDRIVNLKGPDRAISTDYVQGLRLILAKRFVAIAGSEKDYLVAPSYLTNKFMLLVATSISGILKEGRYRLLMPSLADVFTYSQNVLFTDIDDGDNKLRHFVPADGNKQHMYTRLIYVVETLQYFKTTGKFLHLITSDNQNDTLSETEIRRVVEHSKFTKAYYDAIVKLNDVKISKLTFGGILQSLSSALIDGGVGMAAQKYNAIVAALKRTKNKINSDVYKSEALNQFQIPNRDNVELNAQASANIAIAEFLMWYENLNQKDKDKLSEITKNDILDILFKFKNLNDTHIIKVDKKPDIKNIQNLSANNGLYVRYKNELYFVSPDFTVEKDGPEKGIAQPRLNKNNDVIYKFILIHDFDRVIKEFDHIVGVIGKQRTRLTVEQCFKITDLIGHANHNIFNPGNCVVSTSGSIDILINAYRDALFSNSPGENNPEYDETTYKMLEAMCQLKYDELKFWIGLDEYPISKAKVSSTIDERSNELIIPVERSFEEAIVKARQEPEDVARLLLLFFSDKDYKYLKYFNKVHVANVDFQSVATKINENRTWRNKTDAYTIMQILMEHGVLEVNTLEQALVYMLYIDKGYVTQNNLEILQKFVKSKNDMLFILNHDKFSSLVEVLLDKLSFDIENAEEYAEFCKQIDHKNKAIYFNHTKIQCAELVKNYDNLETILNINIENIHEIISLSASVINSFMTRELLKKFIESHENNFNIVLSKILENDLLKDLLDDTQTLVLYFFLCLDTEDRIHFYQDFSDLLAKHLSQENIEYLYSKIESDEKKLFIEVLKERLPELVKNGHQLAFYVNGLDEKAIEIFTFIDVKTFINDADVYVECAQNHSYQSKIINDVLPMLINSCANIDDLVKILCYATPATAELIINDLIRKNLLITLVNDAQDFVKLSGVLKMSVLMWKIIEHFNKSLIPLKSLILTSDDLAIILTNIHPNILILVFKSVDLSKIIQNMFDFNLIEKCIVQNDEAKSLTAYQYFYEALTPYLWKIKGIRSTNRDSVFLPQTGASLSGSGAFRLFAPAQGNKSSQESETKNTLNKGPG